MANPVGARPFNILDFLLEETTELCEKLEGLEHTFHGLTRSLNDAIREANECYDVCGSELGIANGVYLIKKKLQVDIPANKRVLPTLTGKVETMLQRMAFIAGHMKRMNENAIDLRSRSYELETKLKELEFGTQLPGVQHPS